LASGMFRELKKNYLKKQCSRIERCTQLYSEYTREYHKFLLVRDLHVRLAGSSFNINSDSDFAKDELLAYKRAMLRAREYLLYTIRSYDPQMVVPARNLDIYAMSRERVRDEFLAPIHPDLSNFIVSEALPGRFGSFEVIELKIYADVLTRMSEIREVGDRLKELLFIYYPRFSMRPTVSNGICIPSNLKSVGAIEGSLVYSAAERAGVLRGALEDSTPLLYHLQVKVLRFLFPGIKSTGVRKILFKKKNRVR